MRIIDADELKTYKFLSPQVRILGGRRNGKVLVAAYQQGWNDAIDAIVDNEPTVCNDNYAMGYQDGVKKVLSERPQGEWIEDIENLLYRCSNCNASSNIRMFKSNLHFCPNCGADMRKETEND